MAMFRLAWREWLQRRANDIWYRGFAAGYQEGHNDGLEFFTERLIQELQNDAVLSMTADIDTIERVVEVIEAVEYIGKTPR
jgi:flagellar biosynthesis/type III secretory pathway protein FliH